MEARRPANDAELRSWLENMIWHHHYGDEEISGATGYGLEDIQRFRAQFDINVNNRPKRPEGSPLLVLPYPGGRHPRIQFLEGAVNPQRETKFSIFTPWDETSYAVVDLPEAIWSNLGLTYLAHTHVDTLWTKQKVTLPRLEWQRGEGGRLNLERTLPNGIKYAARVVPGKDAVQMELDLTNGTPQPISDLRIQICVMLKGLTQFEQLTNANKVLLNPYVATRDTSGKRWIITGWEYCHRAWANPPCPCMHADPKFPDLQPGKSHTLKGRLSFYEGTDVLGEMRRIDGLNWRNDPPTAE